MASATEKLCSVCGADVSSAKRVKDAAGNYYCEACAHATRTRQQPPSQDSRSQDKFCQNCGNKVGALRQLYEWEGHQVCLPCRDDLKYEKERQEEDQHRRAEDESLRARQQEEANAAAAHLAKRGQGARYKLLLSMIVCVLGAASILFSGTVMDLPGWVKWGFFSLLLLGGAEGVFKYRKLARSQSFVKSVKGDLLPSLASAGRGCAFGTLMAVGVVGIPAAAFWGGRWWGCRIFGDDSFFAWGVALACVSVGVFLSLWVASSIDAKWCPHCSKFKARIEGVELLGQQAVTTRTHETATVHKGYGAFGPVIETIRMPVERTRLINRYARHRHCNACGVRWTTK